MLTWGEWSSLLHSDSSVSVSSSGADGRVWDTLCSYLDISLVWPLLEKQGRPKIDISLHASFTQPHAEVIHTAPS